MAKFTLALYQGHPVTGDIEATLRKMETVAESARHRNVDLLVFPELFVTGYLPELWERIPDANEEDKWLTRLTTVAQKMGLWMVFGHPSFLVRPEPPLDRSKGRFSGRGMTNAASLIAPGRVVGTYAKVHLYGDESKTFIYGSEFPVWDTIFGRVALQICYDVEFPEAARVAAIQGADLLINIANNMVPYGEHHVLFTMARALENGIFVATVNRTAEENGILFCGQSCVAHPQGTWLLKQGEEEGLFCVELDLKERDVLDASVQYLAHRRPEVYSKIIQQ